MSYEEAATALGIAVPTAKKWWAYARAWLAVELGPRPADEANGNYRKN
jgi:DNA-directed RNA polymerase specialized sigma24 family protein